MPTYQIAHIKEQGVDLIVVPLDSPFGSQPQSAQDAFVAELQVRARSAGLAGTVVAVWDAGGGRMAFLAPPNFHPFFRSIGLAYVHANINRTLSWSVA